MATIAKSNSDNFLTWQKVTGTLTLNRLQTFGLDLCSTGFNLSDLRRNTLGDLDVSSQTGSPRGLEWASNGLSFIAGNNGTTIYQWIVSTPYNAASYSSVVSKSFAAQLSVVKGCRFSSNGLILYVVDTSEKIHQYDLSPAWDIDSRAFDHTFDMSPLGPDPDTLPTNIEGFDISSTNVYITCKVNSVKTVRQYSWNGSDVSTMSFVANYTIVGNDFTDVVYISETKLYLVDDLNIIYELTMTGGNVATASISQTGTIPIPASSTIQGLYMASDGLTLWVCENNLDYVREVYIGCP